MASDLRDIDQGALTRARADLSNLSTHWWRFRIPAGALTALFAIRGALLPSDASTFERVVLAIGGTLGGALLLGGLAFIFLLLTAPLRQRNEARNAVRNLESSADNDPQALVRGYSAWVQMIRATLPSYPHRSGPLVLSDQTAHEKRQAEWAAAMQRYQQTKDEVVRAAQREYHEQFRAPLKQLIGEHHQGLVDNPRTIKDFEEVEREVVRRLAASQQTPPPEEAVSRLRRSVGLLVDELRTGKGTITAALERETYWPQDAGLTKVRWDQVGSDLIGHGLGDVHAVVSAAYSQMDALNQDALDTWSAMEAHYGYDPPPGMRPTIRGNTAALEAALDAISKAETALARARL